MQSSGQKCQASQLAFLAAIRDLDLPTAEESLAEADKLEPDLVTLVDLRLQVRAMKGDFAGVVAELRRFAEATATVITPAKLKAPVLDEFKRSPEFAEWAKAFK